jgi:AcrR family transcriptional regulator
MRADDRIDTTMAPPNDPGGARRSEQPSARAGTRPYLRSDARRRQLLQVAARIAGQEGLEALTIVGLANAAGVSRQLVYDHFSDVSSLVAAMLMDHFAAVDEAIARSIMPESAPDPIDTPLEAARRFLELSREDRHILRSLIAHTDAPEHELSGLAVQMRERSIDRWSEILGARSNVGARARTWALVHALQGLSDLVSTGVLTVDEALQDFRALFEAGVAAPLIDGSQLLESNDPGTKRGKTVASSRRRTPARG